MQSLGRIARPYSNAPSVRPGGQQVALTVWEGQSDIFVYDLARDDFDRVTSDPHNDFFPVWTPDGRDLVFTSIRGGQLDLYIGPADRSRPDSLLYASSYPKWANSWSPDGNLLAFMESNPKTGFDLWIYSNIDRKAQPFRSAPFNESFPRFSPDGRWLAYQSDELGQYEVYVVPYPGPGPTCKVSPAGGAEPRWSADGTALFYRQGSRAMVVEAADRNFCNARPTLLFEGLDVMFWDVSPNGEFFITLEPREPPTLHLVLNWHEELRRLVPTN
jgi:TolB protein